MTKLYLLALLLALPLMHTRAQHSHADGREHSHSPSTQPVKRTGRLLTEEGHQFEFRLLPDNHVILIPLNEQFKPVSPGEQDLHLTGGDRSAPVRLTFDKKEDRWVSAEAVPDVRNMPVVLRVGIDGEHPVFFRFQLNRAICGGCGKMEYACSCDHGH